MQSLREIVWPTSGWQRTATYWGHRILRLQASPHSIAVGLAAGAAVSMTPFVGTHLVLTLLICWALGGHSFAGFLGTLVGNPWTFPFIWMFTYRLGCAILGMEAGIPGPIELSLDGLFTTAFQSIAPMVGPMIVGSIPVAIAAWWVTYVPAKYLITTHRRRRAERLAAKIARQSKPFIDQGGAAQG